MTDAVATGGAQTFERISAVITVHNSASVLPTCLESLRHIPRIVIVDNASTDDSVEVAMRCHPGVEVVSNPDNSGLPIAINLGLAHVSTEYVLLMNPDAGIAPDCLGHLERDLDDCPAAAAAAPLITNARGNPEIDVMGPGEHNHHKIAVPPDGPFCTWFVTLAMALWRREVLEALGGLDENIFLYQEDADICVRATQAGHTFILDPRAECDHFGGASEGMSVKTRWRKDWNQTWSTFYYEDKHGAPGSGTELARRMVGPCTLKALLGVLLLRRKMVVGYLAKASAARRYASGGASWRREGAGPQAELARRRAHEG